MIVSRMISWLYYLMSSVALFFMVLHISAYSVLCFPSPFSTVSRRFVIRAHIGDDLLHFSDVLISSASVDALCWIIYVMVSFMVSIVLVVTRIGFSIQVRIRSSLILFVWHLLLVASWSSTFFHSKSTSSLMLLITILRSLPMLT